MTSGVIPGAGSDSAGVRGGTTSAGTGRSADTGAPAGCWRSTRRRPSAPATRAAPRNPPDRSRKRRRFQSGIDRAAVAGSGGPPAPAGSVSGRMKPPAARSMRNVPTPAAVATTAFRAASGAESSGCRNAATKATNPNAAKMRQARPKPRRPRIPAPAATASATSTTATFSAVLSPVPKRVATRSFAPGGCRAITRLPTATTRDGVPGTSPASSSLAAIPTAPATIPAAAARAAGPGGGTARARDVAAGRSMVGFTVGMLSAQGRGDDRAGETIACRVAVSHRATVGRPATVFTRDRAGRRRRACAPAAVPYHSVPRRPCWSAPCPLCAPIPRW